MKLKPLFDKVVVKELEEKETVQNGIFLPSQAKEKQEVAVVVAVGEGGNVDGTEVKMIVKPGDKVLYSKYSGSQFKLDGETVTIIRQSDILAIVEYQGDDRQWLNKSNTPKRQEEVLKKA